MPDGAVHPSRLRHRLQDLVDRFGGTCGGDLDRTVTGFAPLDEATAEHLAFVTASRYRTAIEASRAAAILVTSKDAESLPMHAPRLWVCADPYLSFARISQYLDERRRPHAAPSIHPTAVIDAGARIDPSASVGPQVVIGAGVVVAADVTIGAGSTIGDGCSIGQGTLLHAGVAIQHDCIVGRRCIVHPGAVIGADGFGFARDGATWVKIPQVGGVVIGDDVEIGANTTIDRGTLGDTILGNGVKLDNQIQIAHNVRVGDDTIMAAFVGVAGSAVIGKRCMIGGAARIMGHVTIVDDVVVSTQTFVSRSIGKRGQYTGYYPMAEHAEFEKSAAVLRRLDRLRDRVRHLETASLPTTAVKPTETDAGSSVETGADPSDPPEPESPA